MAYTYIGHSHWVPDGGGQYLRLACQECREPIFSGADEKRQRIREEYRAGKSTRRPIIEQSPGLCKCGTWHLEFVSKTTPFDIDKMSISFQPFED